MFSVIALDIHGLFGLILAVAGVAMFGFGLWKLLPVRWRLTYRRLLRGDRAGHCRYCDARTTGGADYCCEEHEIIDQQSRAW